MPSITDTLLSLFKGAGQSDEEAQASAAKLAAHPDAEQAVTPLMAPPSSFDVHESTSPVVQGGSMPGVNAPPPATVLPPLPPEASPTPSSSPSPVATTSTPSAAPASTVSSKPMTPPPAPTATMPTNSADQATRDAAMADALKKRKMAVLPALAAGFSDATNTGLKAFGINAPTDQQEKLLDRAKANFEESKGLLEEKISNDPNSDASKTARNLVLQIAPQMANDPNFATMSDKMLRDKLPLVDTMMKAKAAEDNRKLGLEQMKSNKDISLGLRQDQQQDKLEQNAKLMVSNLRGDKSLARTEEQRDAAIQVMDTMNQVKQGKLILSEPVYYDLMAQLYRARNGVATTAEAMREMTQKTFKGDAVRAITYLTGKPGGATTSGIVKNISDFATDTGNMADKLHEGYMKAHLIKPHGLDDERWQPILQTGRGLSFADSTKLHQATAESNQGSTKGTASNDPMGLR